MSRFCQWFYANSSQSARATLRMENGILRAENEHGEWREEPLDAVRISDRLGNVPRQIVFSDGTTLSVEDNAYIDAALSAGGGRAALSGRRAHILETRWLAVAALVVAGALALYWLYVSGVPRAAAAVAKRVPAEYVSDLSGAVYDNIRQQGILRATTLSPEMQARARRLFNDVTQKLPPVDSDNNAFAARLTLQSMRFGDVEVANAFAFPDGMIVVSDKLLRALTDDEIKAIIAHEIGHVRLRHGLRSVIGASGMAIVFAALFGDYTGLSVAPVVLAQLSYSRDFEREADCFAYDYLTAIGASPTLIGEALVKIERDMGMRFDADADADDADADAGSKDANDSSAGAGEDNNDESESEIWWRVIEALSTHPHTDERLKLSESCRQG